MKEYTFSSLEKKFFLVFSFFLEALLAKDVGILVKTAFPLQNENIGKCLWAMVEEQDHDFWLQGPTVAPTTLLQPLLPPHVTHSSLY